MRSNVWDFQGHFIDLIHACIATPTFSVLINGQVYDQLRSQRGIRQGCPPSIYLFVIAINQLSINFKRRSNTIISQVFHSDLIVHLFILYFLRMTSLFVVKLISRKCT